VPTCFTVMEVERIGRRKILFIDFERREERLDEQLLSGLVGVIYKELVGKAGLSLAADGCRVRGTLAKPGCYFRKEVYQSIASYGSMGCLHNVVV
jgi:hypothetical protein